MNKKTLIVSILAAALLVLTSLTSVVGINVVKSNAEEENIASPLFAVRTQRSVNKEENGKISSNYLGKGKTLPIFFGKKTTFHSAIDRTLKLLQRNPMFLSKLLEKLETHPQIVNMLRENDISMSEFKAYLNIIKDNPSLLEKVIKKTEIPLPAGDPPMPLNLSTSNPLGCFIVAAFALLPVAIVIALLLGFFTLRIFYCLFQLEETAENIYRQLVQGLIPPE